MSDQEDCFAHQASGRQCQWQQDDGNEEACLLLQTVPLMPCSLSPAWASSAGVGPRMLFREFSAASRAMLRPKAWQRCRVTAGAHLRGVRRGCCRTECSFGRPAASAATLRSRPPVSITMVQFGREFDASKKPAWSYAYLDYAALKEQLRFVTAALAAEGAAAAAGGGASVHLQHYKRMFQRHLDAEIDKVLKFYQVR